MPSGAGCAVESHTFSSDSLKQETIFEHVLNTANFLLKDNLVSLTVLIGWESKAEGRGWRQIDPETTAGSQTIP